ncbi:MAG: fibronectin type III domain-containing protein [Desulfosarcina sp.]|jgi:hypothetical protein
MTPFVRFHLKVIFATMAIVAMAATWAFSANVTLSWDANNPAPEGYRVFIRESGQSYNYLNPIWEDNITTCTLTGLTEGVTYHFVVRAFDDTLESADSAEVTYTPVPVVANQAPAADAGTNQVVYEGAAVTLNGSGSSDADGSIAGYEWSQTGGSAVTLTHPTTAQASFTAPVVDLDGELFTFRLTVNDDEGASSIATTTVNVLKSSSTDVDGDNVPDVLDRFPNDAGEWADNDNDGVGDNQDTDDDNDGMTDSWELSYGLDPLSDADAGQDADGDGVSNLAEFHAESNPTAAPANTVPDAPVIDTAVQTERVGLTPVLVTDAYFDIDNDDHYRSRWQISTESNFATLILDETCHSQLTAYTVGDMVLDADTVYYWRVKFVDERNGASEWSPTATFTTLAVEDSDDRDINGIPDAQEVDASADVDEDGTPDCQEANIMSVNTVEGQTMVGVEPLSSDVTLVSIKSLPTDSIPDNSVKMGFGLIGFKLYLHNQATTATVKIHFGKKVPQDATLYKYMTDTGWQVYPNAVFSPDRKSVTLMLVDGGMGDEDRVENGVIVDPSGVAYTVDNASFSTAGDSSSGSVSSDDRSCFISAGTTGAGMNEAAALVVGLLTAMIAVGACFLFVRPSIQTDRR